MREKKDNQAEIEAARKRLKGFIKKASEAKPYPADPETRANWKTRSPNGPRMMTWADVAKSL
jgi:hypothetical protein